MSLFEIGVTCTPLAVTGGSVYAIWATNHIDERLKILLINLAWFGVASSLLGIILTLPQDVNSLEELGQHLVSALNGFQALDPAIREGLSAGAFMGPPAFGLAIVCSNWLLSDDASRIIWKGPALFGVLVACGFVFIGTQAYNSEHTYSYLGCR